jgi:hypothetical protein
MRVRTTAFFGCAPDEKCVVGRSGGHHGRWALTSMSQRAYARRRGCALSAVQRAIRTGRLSKSLTPGGQIAEPELADREWDRTTQSDRVPITVRARKEARRRPALPPGPPTPAVAAAARRLRELVGEDMLKLQEHVLASVPHVVDGAAAALAAAGRDVSVAELAQALGFDAEDGALHVSTELIEAAMDGQRPEAGRDVGRGAVLRERAIDGEA